MLKRKLFWWTDKSDSEWLSIRFNKWAAQYQGYSKLRPSRLSKGYQTMMDRPEQPKAVWTRATKEVIVDFQQLTDQNTETLLNQEINKVNLLDMESWEEEQQCPAVSNSSLNNVFRKQEIIDYINYLNRPVINMNDNYIEIHQYHFSPEMLQPMSNSEGTVRPPIRRKHRINKLSTDIVNSSVLESKFSGDYSEFLVKKSDKLNCNNKTDPGVLSTENAFETKNSPKNTSRNDNDLDEHRELYQDIAEKQANVCKEEELRIRRGHTFTPGSLNNKCEEPLKGEHDAKHFLSFRSSKKYRSGRRKKKVVVGEKGLDGPIWPGVLLTFNRAVSPVQLECDDNEEHNAKHKD